MSTRVPPTGLLRRPAVLLAAFLALSCISDASGPEVTRLGSFSIAPTFGSQPAGIVPIDRVRVIGIRQRSNEQVLDTVVAVPAGADSVNLTLTVPTEGPSDTILVNLTLITPAGDTAFRAGPIPTVPSVGLSPPVTLPAPFTYVGTGANAMDVVIVDSMATGALGQTVTLTAVALDANGDPIPNTPQGWTTLDGTRLVVPDLRQGVIQAQLIRGPAQVAVELVTGQADTATVDVVAVPIGIAIVSGDGQSGQDGQVLAQPLVVRVTAADGLGVQGVPVVFAVVAGGGSISADTVLTDAAGDAQVSFTLGPGPGTQQVTATTSAGTVTFNAGFPSVGGGAAFINIVTGDNQIVPVSTAVPIAPTVVVTDSGGAPVGGVPVTFRVTSGGGSVTGATPLTQSDGTASVGSWTLGAAVGSNFLQALVMRGALSAPHQDGDSTVAAMGGGPPDTLTVTFSATGVVAATKTWTGAISSDWSTAGNWSPTGVPIATDDVSIPAGTPNEPVLSASVDVNDLTVAATATLNIGSFTLTATGDVDAGATIIGTGAVVLLGSGTLRGTLPEVITDGADVTLNGPTFVNGDFTVAGAGSNLDIGGQTLSVAGDLTLATATQLVMVDPVDFVAVGGNADFQGNSTRNPTPTLTAGTLLVAGDFTQQDAFNAESFASTGTTVVLNGTGTQTVTFDSPDAATGSFFYDLVLASPSVVLATPALATGQLISTVGTLVSGGGNPLDVSGLNVIGAVLDNVLLTSTDGTLSAFDNVTFQGYTATQVQLTVQHPGAGTPFVFDGLTFDAVSPTPPGYYISAADSDQGAPFLEIDLTNSTPTDGSTETLLSGGAMVNWSVAVPVKTWTAASNTDWSDAGNWSPTGVPTGSDDVSIPSGTPGDPILSANVSVNDLTVASGASVNTNGFNLTANGNVDAGTTITGTGTVVLAGAGTTATGSMPNVTVTGTVSLAGLTTVTGTLTISSGNLTINGQTVAVSGDMNVSGGRFTMSDPADLVSIEGSFSVTSNTSNTGLTDGVMVIDGDFTQVAGSSINFGANTAHSVILTGTTLQTVTFTSGGLSTSRFYDLEVANTGPGVDFATNAAANGTVTMTSGNATGVGSTMFIGDALVDASGTAWQVENTTFTGATPTLPATLTTNLGFTSNPAALQTSFAVTGNLTVISGNLDINGQSASVSGSMSVTGGVFTMNAGDLLSVGGSFSVTSNSSNTGLTGGVLEVGGDFTQTAGSSINFGANTAHTVVLNGSALQTVSFTSAGAGSSRFYNLEIANTGAGVDFATSAAANGTVTVTSGDATGVGSNVTIGADLVDASGTRWQVGTTTFTGATPSLPATLTTNLVFAGSPSALASSFTATGNLSVTGGNLDINGQTVSVSGNMSVTSGVFTMGTGDLLSVGGSFSVTSNSSNSVLTGGVLEVGGDFTQVAGSSINFGASIAHTVILNGSGLQTLSFTSAGATSSRFYNLEIANTGPGVDFATSAAANGTVTMTSGDATGASSNVTIGADLVDASGTRWQVGTTTFTGASPSLPATLTTNLVFNGSPAALASSFAVTGNLNVTGGNLDINGQTVSVSGNMSVSSGVFTMGTGDLLSVGGSFSVTSNSSNSGLTGGVLEVGGDFTQTAGSSLNFGANTAHTVILNGSTLQSVSFTSSGASSSRFYNLEIANTGPGVDFTTSAAANGTVTMTSGVATGTAVSMTIGGDLADASGTAWQVEFTAFTGGTPTLPTTVSTNVQFAGTPAVLQNSFAVTGDLDVTGGNLDINGQTVTVSGDMSVTGGVFTMDASDLVSVAGNFSVTSNSSNSGLTGGVLEVGGDFTQVAGSSINFGASTTHRVILNGTGSQTVSFGSPGAGGSRFGILELSNTGTGVTLSSGVVVTAELVSGSVTLIGGGNALTVSGLNVDGLTLDDVSFTWSGGTLSAFDNVTFQGYTNLDVQFVISHPGAAAGAFVFNNLNFLVAPAVGGPGAYIEATDSDGVTPFLTINVVGSTPASGAALSRTFGGAILNW